MDFLPTSPEGQLMKPNFMGMDNVKPPKSRLKVYFTSRHTSFQSFKEFMTIGELRDVSESSLQNPRSLILAVLGLLDIYSEDAEVSVESTGSNKWRDFEALCEGYTYFFDIAPTSGKPEVKFYLNTRKYRADDLTIAQNLVAWLHAHGRGAYADACLGMLEKLAEHRGLENGKGLHAYISYQCTEKGEPDIKSYISPELYHRARYAAVWIGYAGETHHRATSNPCRTNSDIAEWHVHVVLEWPLSKSKWSCHVQASSRRKSLELSLLLQWTSSHRHWPGTLCSVCIQGNPHSWRRTAGQSYRFSRSQVFKIIHRWSLRFKTETPPMNRAHKSSENPLSWMPADVAWRSWMALSRRSESRWLDSSRTYFGSRVVINASIAKCVTSSYSPPDMERGCPRGATSIRR